MCIRPTKSLLPEDTQRVVQKYAAIYNRERLHSAIGYVTPQDKLEGREERVFAERRRKLIVAREARAQARQPIHSKRFLDLPPDGPEAGAACAA